MAAEPVRSLVICTTPRSGSTLLCALLRASGVAGWPESWYRAEDRAEYLQDWGIETDSPAAYLTGVLGAGRGANGVFGIRVQAVSRQPMLRELAQALGPADDRTLLHRAFGPCTFLHVFRRNSVAQAVSRLKAKASQIWHLDGSERASTAGAPL